MILEVYATLFIISLAFLFLGYYAKVETIKVLGFGIIFVLGVVLLGYGDRLEYKSGETKTNNMACGGCSDTRFSNTSNITGFYVASINTVDTYSTYTNNTLGFLLSTLAFLGWLSIYLDYRVRG